MNARFPYLFALVLTLPLASCRFVGMKPDFSVMGDAFTPVEPDSVVVESKPGASTPLAGYTPREAAPAAGQNTSLFSQQQPAALSQNQPTQSAAARVKFYTVQPGDSLSRIARMHKVPLGSLAGANGIDLQKPLIKPGQQLRIPQGGAAISAPPRSASVPPPAAAAQPTATAKPAATAQPAAKAVPAPLLTLKPAAPAATPAPAPAPAPAATPAPATKPATAATPAPAGTYRVCAGDTLYRIARKHGISLQQLLQANKLTEESARSVRVGTLLTLPAHP